MSQLKKESAETILLVDDEAEIVQFVRDALEDEGFSVLTALDGQQALIIARQRHPDLLILDITMPYLDGFAVCSMLREELDIPILLLSARQSDADKVRGLGLGADDYITKPFSMKELIARIEAHLRRVRRGKQSRAPIVLTQGQLTVNLSAHEVAFAGEPIAMTRKEFELLQLLMLHPHQIFSREMIYNHIWGMDALGSTETVMEHVKRIRRKLELVDPDTQYIGTVWGVGYKWEPSTRT
ncbi:MAG TPA: response regulator transcription factor [Ktedonobacteraceae bacterium]|nr:response regulator transcription factor [Ktedonobacteraceae bacterium]